MNYFEFYGLPINLKIDTPDLKKRFYAKSREFHPDFHSQATETDQALMLEKASFNNKAFATLSDLRSRTKYILELFGQLSKDDDHKIPQSFLMEMMEINEGLMELEMNFREETVQELQSMIDRLKHENRSNLENIMELPLTEETEKGIFSQIKEFYLESKYLERIQENIIRVKSQHQ